MCVDARKYVKLRARPAVCAGAPVEDICVVRPNESVRAEDFVGYRIRTVAQPNATSLTKAG